MKSQRPRGFALAMTLIIVALVSIVTFTAVNISTLDSRASTADLVASKAYYAARAGLDLGRSHLYDGTSFPWSQSNVSFGHNDCSFDVAVSKVTVRGSDAWMINATGRYRDATRNLLAYVADETFAKYAYFTDGEISSYSGGTIYFTSSDSITGPAHTNGYFSIDGRPEFSDRTDSSNFHNTQSPSASPAFDPFYKITPTVRYVNTDTGTTETSPSRFYHPRDTYSQDRPVALVNDTTGLPSPNFTFAGGVPKVPLPIDTGAIASNATTSIINASVNSSLGSYADKPFSCSVDSAGRPSNYYRYDGSPVPDPLPDAPASGWVSVSASKAPPFYRLVFSGSPAQLTVSQWDAGANKFKTVGSPIDTSTSPGVTIHVNGMASVEGQVSGRVTLGVTKNLHIVDDVTYKDKTKDVLGMLAQQSIIVEPDGSPREIDATMMALHGSFTVDDFNTVAPQGKLTVLGGICQKARGPVGTFYSGNPPTTASGYNKDYKYDSRLANPRMAPMNWPHTGNSFFVLLDKGSFQ